MSIAVNLIQLAADEGSIVALDECEKLVDALETILECGSGHEKLIASELLNNIQEAIIQITQTNAVSIAQNK